MIRRPRTLAIVSLTAVFLLPHSLQANQASDTLNPTSSKGSVGTPAPTSGTLGTGASVASVQKPSTFRKNFRLYYNAWLLGPRFGAIDGQKNKGANLQVQNFIKANYHLGDYWWARVSQRVDFNFGERTLYSLSGDTLKRVNVWDPAIGVSKGRIFKEEKHGFEMRAMLLYFLPISSSTRNDNGTDRDRSNGRTFLQTVLSKYISEDAGLWAEIDYGYWQWYTANPTFDNINRHFELYHLIGWDISNTFTTYVSYNNFPMRWRDGFDTQWRERHTIEWGVDFKLFDNVFLNPFLETPFMLKDTSYTMILRTRLM